jgi:hypothetical protein
MKHRDIEAASYKVISLSEEFKNLIKNENKWRNIYICLYVSPVMCCPCIRRLPSTQFVGWGNGKDKVINLCEPN